MVNELVVYILYLPSGKYYVGSTREFQKRLRRHIRELEKNAHHCKPFQEAWNLEKAIDKIATITVSSEEIARQTEQLLLDNLSSQLQLMNVGKSSIGGDNLSRNPNRDSIIEKMTSTIKDRMSVLSDEERAVKFGQPGDKNGMFGKTHTESARKLMSIARTGKSNGLGRKLSEEHVAKISERAKLRTGSKNPFFGKTHSEKTRALIAAKNIGRKPTNMRMVQIGDKVYESVTEAAKSLNIGAALIIHRIKSKNPRFDNYSYV